jgi:hypothetical protein
MTDVWDQFPDPPKPQGGGDPWAQFPDHPGVSNVMRQEPPAGAGQTPPSAPTAAPAPPQAATSGPIADIAKSAGIGLVQGALGIPGLPGNLEYLARAGIDKAASGLGFENPGLSKSHVLPTSADVQGAVEKYTGPFYQPQTTAGEYARTVGEFAPLAAFGGPEAGLLSRATNVVAPAVASETAGQLTKGTSWEPWARAVGGLVGGLLPNAAMRTVTPITNDAARQASVNLLRHEGVDALTAGQQTGNSAVRWAESAAHDLPFSGGRGKVLNDQAAEQFTAAALRHAGIDGTRADAATINQGYQNLGNQFDALAQRNMMHVDQPLQADVHQALTNYNRATPEALRAPIVEGLHEDIMNAPNGILTGDQYQAWRSQIERARRGSQQTNPHLAEALSDIRDALDDAMSRSATPQDQALWQQTRLQYRNLLAIEKAVSGAGENTALGLISPSQLRTAVKTQNSRTYVRGQNDLGNLARAGEAIMKPLPNSGTPARLAAQHMASTIGSAIGYGTANIPGAILGALAPGTMARTIMSRPVQNYLSNQLLAPAIDAYAPTNALMRVPQAANALVQPPTLTGGIGPRYDANGNLMSAH